MWLAVEAAPTIVVVIAVVSIVSGGGIASVLCFFFFLVVVVIFCAIVIIVVIVGIGGVTSFFCECGAVIYVFWLSDIGHWVVVLGKVLVDGLFEFSVVWSGGGGGGGGDGGWFAGGGGGGRRVLAGFVAVKAVAILIFREEIGVLLFLLIVWSFFIVWDDNVVGGAGDFVKELAISCMRMQ